MNIALPKQERGVSINNGGSGIRINGVKEWGLVFAADLHSWRDMTSNAIIQGPPKAVPLEWRVRHDQG